jgi:hypothetical protein
MNFMAAFLKDAGYARSLARRMFFLFTLFLFCSAFAAPALAAVEIGNRDQFLAFRDRLNNGIIDVDQTYQLRSDIDLGGMEWTPIGAVFSDSRYFTGKFYGNGHTVSNFKIVSPDYSHEFAGLFGVISGDALIRDLNVTGFEINVGRRGDENGSAEFVRALIEKASPGLLTKLDDILQDKGWEDAAYAISRLFKDLFAGGLAGVVGGNASIENCNVEGSVSVSVPAISPSTISSLIAAELLELKSGISFALAGGLVGGQAGGKIDGVSATGSVTGTTVGDADITLAIVGGLIGGQTGGSLTNGYAANEVSVTKDADKPIVVAGGLIGGQLGGKVAKSFATGYVFGTGTKNAIAGGFIGAASEKFTYKHTLNNDLKGTIDLVLGGSALIENTYATGPVSVDEKGTDVVSAGGFVGYRLNGAGDSAGKIKSSYATGRVDGPDGNEKSKTGAGGFIGYNASKLSEVTYSVFDAQSTGRENYKGAGVDLITPPRGLKNAEMTGEGVPGLVKTDWSFASGYYPELADLPDWPATFLAASDFSVVPALFVGTDTIQNIMQAIKVPKRTKNNVPVSVNVEPENALTVRDDSDGHWLLTPVTDEDAVLTVRAETGAMTMTKIFPLGEKRSHSISLFPPELNFSASTVEYALGTVSRDVTVKNTGTKPTGALTVVLSGRDAGYFSLLPESLSSIAVKGKFDVFKVIPTGSDEKRYEATVTVSNEENGILKELPVIFTLRPHYVPEYDFTLYPLELDFSSAIWGYAPRTPLEVTVTNTGAQKTGKLKIELLGENKNDFELLETSLDTIAANDSAKFTVVPVTGLPIGSYSAAVKVSDIDNNSKVADLRFIVKPRPPEYDGGGGGGCSSGPEWAALMGLFLSALLKKKRKS